MEQSRTYWDHLHDELDERRVPYDAGMPGFTVIKDFVGYDERLRHTNTDYPERTSEDALKQSAIVFATVAWQAAMADATIPRPPGK